MLTLISLPLLVCSLALVFGEAQTASGLSMQTALIAILAVTVIYCAKKIMEMHDRLAALETPRRSETKSERTEKNIPSEVVAAISAAVVATYGRNARIVTMNRTSSETHAWSVEGRRHIFHSHSVR